MHLFRFELSENDEYSASAHLTVKYGTPSREFECFEVCYSAIGPPYAMSCRPANIHKFVKILKRGYCGETCDVNLKDHGCLLDISADYSDDDEELEQDIWQCGWIDFDWTWKEAVKKNEMMQKRIRNNFDIKNLTFHIFQTSVNIDITEIFNSYDDEIAASIRDDEFLRFRTTKNGRHIISLVFHTDDVENITYFGHKTTVEQQSTAKKNMFNYYTSICSSTTMQSSHKQKLLDAIEYQNYCVITPNGIYCGMSQDKEERKQFVKWTTKHNMEKIHNIYPRECMSFKISSNGLDKIHYDKTDDKLLVKMVPCFTCVLDDASAPQPLEKRYHLPCGSPCRLVEATISDPKLVDQVKMEKIEHGNEKERRYLELLEEWNGFIQVSIDITNEFDQFQERLKTQYIQYVNMNGDDDGDDRININWDNRKYFSNDVHHDKKDDKITYTTYVLLDSEQIHKYDAKFNVFDVFALADYTKIVTNVLQFVDANDVALVCKTWHRMHSISI